MQIFYSISITKDYNVHVMYRFSHHPLLLTMKKFWKNICHQELFLCPKHFAQQLAQRLSVQGMLVDVSINYFMLI